MINQLSVAAGVVWGVLKASVISHFRLSVLIEEQEMKKPIRTLWALMGNCCRFSPLSNSVPDSLSFCALFGKDLTLVPFEASIVWGETKRRFQNLRLRTSNNIDLTSVCDWQAALRFIRTQRIIHWTSAVLIDATLAFFLLRVAHYLPFRAINLLLCFKQIDISVKAVWKWIYWTNQR